MLATVREEMVYNTPPELSDVYTRWEKMWTQIVQEQNVALAEELRKNQIAAWQRQRTINKAKALAAWLGAIAFVLAWMWGVLILIRMSQTYRSLSYFV
jgi:ferric-dicitrate binding protein FerR (iron transport regulator)